MFAWLLIHKDRHDDHHALFDSWEAAGDEIIEVVKKYLEKHPKDFIGEELKELEELMANKEYQQLIEFWNERTPESIDLEEYEVQGCAESAERRNVHAILSSMASQVLIEEVTAIHLDWSLGGPITSEVRYLSKYPLKVLQLNLDIGDKSFDES